MILTLLIYVFHHLWSVNCSMQHQKLVVLIVVRGVEVEVDNTSLAEDLFPVQTLAPNFKFSRAFQLESSSLSRFSESTLDKGEWITLSQLKYKALGLFFRPSNRGCLISTRTWKIQRLS